MKKEALSVVDTLKMALEALEECKRDPRLKYEHPTYEKTITAVKEALMSQSDGAQQNPQGVSNEQVEQRLELIGHADLSINNIYIFSGYGEEVPEGRTPLYARYKNTHPPVPYVVEPRTAQPSDWSVFNTGAEVASGLTFAEAWDYLTPERLDRGWSAVCVVNKDNVPTAQPKEPEQRNASEHLEPVAWIDSSGHPKHLSHVQGIREKQLYGELKPLYTHPPVPYVVEPRTAQPKEPEQRSVSEHLEPVMYQASSDGGKTWFQIELGPYYNTMDEYIKDLQAPNAVPVYLVRNLYTTPPQRKPLTDEEIESINVRLAGNRDLARLFARAIEAAHGIRPSDFKE